MTTEKIDTIKVVLANIGAITITAVNIQTALSIASLSLAISYTAWKWINDIKRKKANIKEYKRKKEEEK